MERDYRIEGTDFLRQSPSCWSEWAICAFVLGFTAPCYRKNEAIQENHAVFHKWASLFICNLFWQIFWTFSYTFKLAVLLRKYLSTVTQFGADTSDSVLFQLTPGTGFYFPIKVQFSLTLSFSFKSFYNCGNLKIAPLGMIIF